MRQSFILVHWGGLWFYCRHIIPNTPWGKQGKPNCCDARWASSLSCISKFVSFLASSAYDHHVCKWQGLVGGRRSHSEKRVLRPFRFFFFFFFCIFYYFFWELFCNCWRVAHKIATSTNPWDQVGGLSHPPIRHKSGWIMSLLPTTVSSQGVTDKKIPIS